MNNFFEGLKNQISTFCICTDSFKNLVLPCYGENKIQKFWLASMKTLTNSEYRPLQIACCGIQEVACVLYIVPLAGDDFKE